jgi:hypothetical protein
MLMKLALGLFVLLGVFHADRLAAETLPLPPGLIGLDSEEGEALLFEAEARAAYLPLSLQFVTQSNQAFCGVASTIMVLNALKVPAPETAAWKPFAAFDQDNIFNDATEAVVPRAVIEKRGMTLTQLAGLSGVFGLKAEIHHASDSTVRDFRRLASEALDSGDRYVLVNYLRLAIGQERFGHISPLGAYDADSDRFLILDVSRYKYPPVWVETAALFAAMNTIDKDNESKSRGFVIIGR